MAKVGAPIDPGPLAALVPACMRIRGTGSTRTARAQHAAPPAWLAASFCNGPETAAALAAWQRMHPWKRLRWLAAAQRQGDPSAERDRSRRGSGWAFFLACWLTQTDRGTALPINPCSRRATSLDASPWDYTP